MSNLLTEDTIAKIIYWAKLPQRDNVNGSYDHGYDSARNYILDFIAQDPLFKLAHPNLISSLVERSNKKDFDIGHFDRLTPELFHRIKMDYFAKNNMFIERIEISEEVYDFLRTDDDWQQIMDVQDYKSPLRDKFFAAMIVGIRVYINSTLNMGITTRKSEYTGCVRMFSANHKGIVVTFSVNCQHKKVEKNEREE